MDSTVLAALLLGFLLGLRHALDADHVVAVSTIVSEYRNPWRALWVGVSWGMGHSMTLLALGLVILVLKMTIPERLALFFEFTVGIVLVVLGLQVFWSFRRRRVHLHDHAHREDTHRHFHSHERTQAHEGHGLPLVGRPFFRAKSFLVGVVHGVAGSAALMLLVLTTMKSIWAGVSYIALFGIGTIAAMGVITVVMGLPFALSAQRPGINRVVRLVAGMASVVFGAFLMYEIGIGEGLFLSVR
jgi:high-affinity nickel permease